MAPYNQTIKSRFLPERSFLYFSYPQKESTTVNKIDFHFPLLENVDISENQKPNLATYDLVGRSGNLFAYLGAKSREFNLKFNITLPNVIDYMSNVGLNEIFERDVFKLKSETKETGILIKREYTTNNLSLNKSNLYETAKGVWNTLNDKNKDPNDTFAELISKFERLTPGVDRRRLDNFTPGGLLDYLDVGNPGSKVRTISNAINYIIMLINIVRTSVINKGSDSRSGPPTIYINHGTMYNNIPCICSNYSIKLNNTAGYDLVSMTPRQIEVNMSLLENRTGDFGKFIPFNLIKGENLAGWEAVLGDNGTLDPYNSNVF